MTQRPGGPAEAAFAVAPPPGRRRSTKIGTSRAGEKKATEAVLRHGASPELLPEIVASIQRVSDIVAEITSASVEQSSGIGQVGEDAGH